MRNFLTVALTAGFVVLGAAAANADTSVYNKYTDTHQYNGYSETNVDAHISSESTTVTESTSVKVEAIADLGDVNIANVEISGTIGGDIDFSADAHSRNGRPVDPVATVYYSEVNQLDVTKTTETADIDTFSSYEFSGTIYEHEVGNRF